MVIFNYDELCAEFNSDLNSKMRNHGAYHESLTLWVPSQQIVEGLSSLIESAITYGQLDFEVSLSAKIINLPQMNEISAVVSDIAAVDWQNIETGWLAVVKTTKLAGHQKQRSHFIQDRLAEEKLVVPDYSYGQSHRSTMPKGFQRILVDMSHDLGGNVDEMSILVKTEHAMMGFELDEDNIILSCVNNAYSQDGCMSNVLGVYGVYAIGKPAREAIDHGINAVVTLLKSKLNGEELDDLPAILLPFNLGPEFVNLHRLLQEMRLKLTKRLDILQYNEFEEEVSNDWSSKTDADKNTSLKHQIEIFNQSFGYNVNASSLVKLENDLSGRPVRVFVEMNDGVKLTDRPKVITDIERFLKDNLDNQLQVYYVEHKDANRIRRLG